MVYSVASALAAMLFASTYCNSPDVLKVTSPS